MKIWRGTIFVIVAFALGFGVYDLWNENEQLENRINEVSAEHQKLIDENRNLEEDIEYYQNPENLLEEAKKNFNYREEGEKMFIIVPEDSESGESEIEQ